MDWVSIFQQLGFPVAATLCLGYVLMRVTIFFGEKIYLPLQEKHFELVKKLELSLDIINAAQKDLVASQKNIVDLISKLSNTVDELENRIKSVEVKV